eukprot:Platyproteum_vivax@DN5896_c0_g1_i1.p1
MATNVFWHHGDINREARKEAAGHQGCTLWMTGLSGSGKSTVAVALEQALYARGVAAYRLDGDNVRHGLNSDLGFSEKERAENIRRIGEVSKLMADAGLVVVASFISPYERDRDLVRQKHEKDELPFVEVYVNCPLEEAEKRDPKGLYKKARAGQIKGFTGIDDPFEAPTAAEVELRTDKLSLEQSVQLLIESLEKQNIIPNMLECKNSRAN